MGRRKKLAFALAAAVLIPIFLLCAAELGLRLAGYGRPTTFFIPREIGGQQFLVENDKFGWRFFPPELARSPTATRIKAEKVPGTIRIFVFGESAALGDPKPAYSMGRYLEVLLRERFPEGKFEVITVAMTAINSHAILPMARECAKLSGDFWIIYMGNNEMMGPFGANPLAGPAAPPLANIRLTLALRATRLGQFLEDRVRQLRAGGDATQSWEGMKTFLSHLVAPNAPERATVRANFQRNLEDIIGAGLASGARPIVCTVAGNLKDCAPFASMHQRTFASEEQGRWDALLRDISELQKNGRFAEALGRARSAVQMDDTFAETHFRLAESALGLGESAAAFEAFGKARDADALPFRTDSAMNGLIRTTAAAKAQRGALLADIEKEFALQTRGMPGDESFFDHVHLTFEGNYRAAKLLAAQVAALLPPNVAQASRTNWAEMDICDRALGLTDWNRRAACLLMLQRLAEPPFSSQSNHARREETLARRIVGYRDRITPEAAAAARTVYEAALAKDADDFRMRENYAEFLESSGDAGGAIAQWTRAAELLPHHVGPQYQLGRLLAREKKHPEARQALAKSLEMRPDLAEARVELGQIALREGQFGPALEEFARAAKLRPQDARVRLLQADALGASGNRAGALEKLREAVQLQPAQWEARFRLGAELAAAERFKEAAVEFKEATRLRPDHAQAHFNLAVALAKSGDLNGAYATFRKTLELDPNHKLAREYFTAMDNAAKAQLQK